MRTERKRRDLRREKAAEAGRLFRIGFHYFNGKTDQYQFFTEHEEFFALGAAAS